MVYRHFSKGRGDLYGELVGVLTNPDPGGLCLHHGIIKSYFNPGKLFAYE